MKSRGRLWLWLLLSAAVVCLPVLGQTTSVPVEESVTPAIRECRATTPVMNGWTRRFPAGWYTNRHDAILKSPLREECRIVFIGDSITHYWERAGKEVWDRDFAPVNALNLGYGADCTEHVLWRLDRGEVDGLKKLKVAVVLIGTNNSGLHGDKPEDTAEGIRAICERLKAKVPQAKILLMAIFPRHAGCPPNDEVNKIIAGFADEKRIFFLDINSSLVDEEGKATREIMPDLLHPNQKGYEIWSRELQQTLGRLM